MNNKVNELADKYFHYVDDLIDDALSWELWRNDENAELWLEVKKALYTDLMLYTVDKLKELKNSKHGF